MARPREFDLEQALDAATETFWEKGYEATSLTDLMEAMGLQKGSIYKAFGSKHSLFLESLKHYLASMRQVMTESMQSAQSPRERLLMFISTSQDLGCSDGNRRGCFALNSLVEMAAHDKAVQKMISHHHETVVDTLASIVDEGKEQGVFRRDIGTKDLALYVSVAAAGLVCMTKASIPQVQSGQVADVILSNLESR